ncbi:poliovirus receptor-related protein 4 isoform X2 [Stegastes partitus]|uniref:Poliovirus receptor-related protein 4 isoform X2 n=1 Tax=Stegastes partitus TaxID=144197 RepID=A0A9Y4K1N8_9TELE|nr:PREDICTED: poliovirus receptor-related protein 4-like isoform X2 [Stegastes partitus]
MTSLLNRLSLCLCVLRIFVLHGEFVEPSPNQALRSLAEKETILPCRYVPTSEGVVVVQVTWYKKKPDNTREQIILAHHVDGYTAFGTWSQRVRFQSSEPTLDSSLVIMNTEVSDEGKYICHVNVFPTGNFDREMSLTVWTVPISSLDPVVLVEGESYRQAAYCRSIAHPPPRLTWDTDLNGQSLNRSLDNGAVSSHYSLHPLRNMNGKKLDCLVWHPAFQTPRRIRNNLVVHFPPHAEVSGYNKDWFVGLENAALRCVSGGNPKPHSFTWIRMEGEMPKDAIPHPNGTLIFRRPLNSSDGGTYQCVATNEVGVGKAEVEILVTGPRDDGKGLENMLMIIVGGVAGGLLILMLAIIIGVTCHHKRKNKKLQRELSQKKEEISTLSRQASFRRVNSMSTDARGTTEENIPLRVEGTLRTSLSSLGEQTHCRDSRSTISGGRGGGGVSGAYDYLGRPVLYNNSRRGRERLLDREEENRLRVETYVRNSSISLQDTHFHPPLTPSPFPMVQSTEIVRQLNGSTIIPSDGGSRPGSVAKTHQHPPVSCTYPPVTDDEDEVDEGLGGPASQEHPDDQDSETNSSQMSEAHSTRYQQTNGTVRPFIRKTPPLVNPHASLIHKAQIV